MISGHDLTLMGVLVFGVHTLGVINAAHAVMNVRLSQSAIAWSLCLITFPWLAIPLYWILGRRKFHGYADAYRQAYAQYSDYTGETYEDLQRHLIAPPAPLTSLDTLARRFTEIPFTSNNQTQLLINGEPTYAAMLAAIRAAKDYILFQFYIINDDEAGREFQQALIQQAQQGVRVYVMYDEIGSSLMTRAYIRQLRQAGIQVSRFNSTKGPHNRLQLNFRNHRKILVIDGQIGFTGGLNIGDEYLGKKQRYGFWRDTHLRLEGPAVKGLQLSFLKDWYWAVRTVPEVSWAIAVPAGADAMALILPTGPADEQQACTLFFHTLINLAQSRLWIATPYFVPDEPTLTALKAAALRGVDVRIILPGHPDHLIVYLCSFSYYRELQSTGIQLYRYRSGFMHQKVILVDDVIAGVGTINLDNRSFLLNFEVMAFLPYGPCVKEIATMLQADLDCAIPVNLLSYDRKPLWFRLAVQVARLFAPLQ
jgi:cardiolipin synthase